MVHQLAQDDNKGSCRSDQHEAHRRAPTMSQ